MSIHIHTGKSGPPVSEKEPNIQSIPCKVFADEDAKVSKYFDPYIQTKEDKTFTGTFRGFPLKGSRIELPGGYLGVILHEKTRPVTEKEDRKFYVTHKFKSMINWNWDTAPSKNDHIVQALEWIPISEALHSPITEE